MTELHLNISPPAPAVLSLNISPSRGAKGDTGPVGPEGPQPDLSADTPEVLGTAAAGVSMEASRSDHVHAMPSAADVGADPAGAAGAVAGDLSTHESLTTTAHGGIVGDTDARLTDARTPLAHVHSGADITSGASTAQWLGPITGKALTAGYYAPRGEVSGGVLVSYPAGVFLAHPIWLWAGTYTIVSIAYYYNAGTATWRVGLYRADGPSGVAGSLVQDFGTVSFVAGSGAGERSKSISVTLTTGWYWLATLVDGFTSSPSVTGFATSSNGPLGPLNGLTSQGSSANPSALYATGVATGALPATAPDLSAFSPVSATPCWRLYRPS